MLLRHCLERGLTTEPESVCVCTQRLSQSQGPVGPLPWISPVAELDGTGAIVSRFVYGTRANVPDYVVKGGVSYRIVHDHLASVRLVIRTTDAVVVQQLAYDEFGRELLNTNPGFQPFGYAGGLSDGQTALLRFGARDYDPESGRWTVKDPVAFNGGVVDEFARTALRSRNLSRPPARWAIRVPPALISVDGNLYAYVSNDPVNFVDPFGRWRFAAEYGTTGDGLAPEILSIESDVDAAFQQVGGRDAIVTFTTNGNHRAGSLHPGGYAIDLRTGDLTADQRRLVASLLREVLGDDYDVVLEGDHLHVESDPDGACARL